jgi:ribose 5-phosphate isomerase A
MRIGVGSGSTVVFAAERLGQLYQEGTLVDIICVPTSFQARQLIQKYKLPLGDLETSPQLDVTFDGADSIDPHLNLIKGGGGACVQEKIVAMCSKRLVVISDESKKAPILGSNWKKGLPVEVIPMGYAPTILLLKEKFGVEAELRMAEKKAGPVVTDNGNFLLDIHFQWASIKPEELDALDISLLRMASVVHTGFFIQMAQVAYVGLANGSVEKLTPL